MKEGKSNAKEKETLLCKARRFLYFITFFELSLRPSAVLDGKIFFYEKYRHFYHGSVYRLAGKNALE